MASIFTRIVSGEIPAVKLYEDDSTLAFMDISPASRGHCLVIPKQEFPDLFSLPPELVGALAATIQRVARALNTTLQPDGMNIIQNNGTAAGQTVFHYHVHLIPRWQGDGALKLWTPGTSSPAELEQIAQDVRAALAAA